MLAMYNREVDEEGKYITDEIDKDAKQLSFCRKTMQTSNYSNVLMNLQYLHGLILFLRIDYHYFYYVEFSIHSQW